LAIISGQRKQLRDNQRKIERQFFVSGTGFSELIPAQSNFKSFYQDLNSLRKITCDGNPRFHYLNKEYGEKKMKKPVK